MVGPEFFVQQPHLSPANVPLDEDRSVDLRPKVFLDEPHPDTTLEENTRGLSDPCLVSP